MGVNQGRVASGLLFRKYITLCVLCMYFIGFLYYVWLYANFIIAYRLVLASEYDSCVEQNTIAHILWACDFLLLSDSEKGMQNQLDGLLKFCYLNLMSAS